MRAGRRGDAQGFGQLSVGLDGRELWHDDHKKSNYWEITREEWGLERVVDWEY